MFLDAWGEDQVEKVNISIERCVTGLWIDRLRIMGKDDRMKRGRSVNRLSLIVCALLFVISNALAQNPFITDQFTADPSARVFEGRVYVYPSHDIPCGKGQGMIGFCMADYHVFSSENLTEWTDHGVMISQGKVPWVDSTSYSMWAPDCIEKDGTYYFYFPARSRDKTFGRGSAVGVATADRPFGPFTPEPKPMEGVLGIDPNPFIDRDGRAYLYWAGFGGLLMARLKENMKELDEKPRKVEELPPKFKEGPYLFERKGIYYFTFPHVENKTERLVYCMGDNPNGPFRYGGVIMDESPTGCWTNHHSVIEYKGQWYLFYHHNDLSPQFDKNRSIRADSLFFNEDGTVRKVTPTWRGVGVTPADMQIQIDRYSAISETGASAAFLDTLKRQEGWKAVLEEKDAWIRYNSVDFSSRKWQSVRLKASGTGGTVEIRLNTGGGPVLTRVQIPESPDWTVVESKLSERPSGIRNLILAMKDGERMEIDWVSFE